MIWEKYVFSRGVEVEELWDQVYAHRKSSNKPVKLLYIAGKGFDIRGNQVVSKFVDRLKASRCTIENAKLVKFGFLGYTLSAELEAQTETNSAAISRSFASIGECCSVIDIPIQTSAGTDDELSTSLALRNGVAQLMGMIGDSTDIVLDVSSLPRIAYLTILLALLARLVPEGVAGIYPLANKTTLQVLVAEDANLDGRISAEDPSNELVLIPGYSEALQSEALRDLPLVWFPILGENRLGQIKRIMNDIPDRAEVCPVLPHPSFNPRRGDELLKEYQELLFKSGATPLGNILYAHESHPFEAYRQLLGAMQRYQTTLEIIGGCRLIVTPLASKLITVGCALACFEMKLKTNGTKSSVAIPYAEPKRYTTTIAALNESRPEISALLLTGEAYDVGH